MANNLLITPAEVLSLAFPPGSGFAASAITDTVILTAQEKFVKPVLGGLYNEILNGKHPELLDDYVKPALALYVKYTLIPHCSCSLGEYGLTVIRSTNLEAASRKEVSAYRKTVRSEALALMKRTVAHIEGTPGSFPSYDPDGNILNRTSIVSQFII